MSDPPRVHDEQSFPPVDRAGVLMSHMARHRPSKPGAMAPSVRLVVAGRSAEAVLLASDAQVAGMQQHTSHNAILCAM